MSHDIIAMVLRASVHRFIGRLARDPETRFFESGSSITSTRMAVNRPGAKRDDGQEPDWFQVEIWGGPGQAFADACRKGQLVDVTGRVKTSRWTDRNTGEERTTVVITAEQWSLVETPGQQQASPPAAAAPAPGQPHPAYAAAGYQPAAPAAAPSSDDIPF